MRWRAIASVCPTNRKEAVNCLHGTYIRWSLSYVESDLKSEMALLDWLHVVLYKNWRSRCLSESWKPRVLRWGRLKKIKGHSAKVLPIIFRLQRFFMSRKTVKYMLWHKVSNYCTRYYYIHPSYGQTSKHFDDTYHSI